ncbi:acetylornithine deacetylase/succinyldiaminopimelate desuccinylase-like deacylase [Massarina eburnea CBS 473.64]|uniref:Acetylornithine deacetylase/succinyldiaminopimelate desuccinylase-like deacylase n=1 Tax=Massarina eburnea CBS 473.64 TaxID=1395130 RepID=A0A6A6S6W9_9PLEO|nr:acetylornithine deacetylase/succinyldiaminopimelate desuccinylase-like deacylase [Massarina eburnea CBS 473.64]
MAMRQDIIAEIEANRDFYIAFLQRFIRAASPNPPGNTTEAAQVISTYLSQQNVAYQIIAPLDHAPNVVADFKGDKGPGQRIILNGHIDTYPVEKPSDWERGPYSGHNDGTMIHGRGGVDMKAGTAASVIAFTLLQKRAESIKGSVALTAVSDEETGGRYGTRYLLENFGDPSPWLGDCMLNGEPGGIESIRFGEKGTLRITFTIKTEGNNGAYTFISRGANVIAAQLITQLLNIEEIEPELPDELRRHFASERARKVADEIMGNGASDALLKPTVNIGVIHGGVKVNTIPQECVFEADIRLPIGLVAKTILAKIDQYLQGFPEASYIVQGAASNPANYCTKDHPFVDCMTKCAEEVTGIIPVMLTGLGGTDCKFYRYRGIPTYVYGPSPRGMGASGEAVSIEEFLALIKTHTLAVWDYLGEADS